MPTVPGHQGVGRFAGPSLVAPHSFSVLSSYSGPSYGPAFEFVDYSLAVRAQSSLYPILPIQPKAHGGRRTVVSKRRGTFQGVVVGVDIISYRRRGGPHHAIRSVVGAAVSLAISMGFPYCLRPPSTLRSPYFCKNEPSPYFPLPSDLDPLHSFRHPPPSCCTGFAPL